MTPPPYPQQYPPPYHQHYTPLPILYHGPPPLERKVKGRFKIALVLIIIALLISLATALANNWYEVKSEEEFEGTQRNVVTRITLDFGLSELDAVLYVGDADTGERIDIEYITEDYGDEDIEHMAYHDVGDQTFSAVLTGILFLSVFLLVTLIFTGFRNITNAGFIRHIPLITGVIAIMVLAISAGYFAMNMPDAVEDEISTWSIGDYESGFKGAFHFFLIAISLVVIATVLAYVPRQKQQIHGSQPSPL